jgi:hypothetical protein
VLGYSIFTLGGGDRKMEAEEQRKAALQALFKAMLHQFDDWPNPRKC